MFEEFKALYTVRRWIRYITWVGLLCAGLFLLIVGGGFPPLAWLVLLQAGADLPSMGSGVLPRLLGAFIVSLFWGCGWCALFAACRLVWQTQRALQEERRQEDAHWAPTRNVSLAFSAPGEHSALNGGWEAVAPRLRLPQRSSQSPLVRVLPGQSDMRDARHPVEPGAKGKPKPVYSALPDIPTRPDMPNSQYQDQLSTNKRVPRVQPLEIGVGWNAGFKRQNAPNEDSLATLQGTYTYEGQLLPFGLFVIADGMGGYEGGLEASRLAVQSMTHTILQNIAMGSELSDHFFVDMLVGGVEWANQAIYQRRQAEGSEMGTTLTAALVIDMKAHIVNVGDSRTYLFRDSAGLIQITHDHSLVASLVAFGQITPDEVYTHPERSKVYRSLGHSLDLKVDSFSIDLSPRDSLLLCSDGMWEMVRDPVIERTIRNGDTPRTTADRLVQAALRGGGVDNVSVIIAQVP
ncbi:MAG: hypothetical protein PVS3B1_29630 [Ktedonobacteraceae bacterium]